MRPSAGDWGPFGRVERRFHPKGGNVPQIGLPEWFAETESSRNRLLISSASLSGRVRALLDMMGHGARSAGIRASICDAPKATIRLHLKIRLGLGGNAHELRNRDRVDPDSRLVPRASTARH